jgi:hypothetical protein
MAKTFGDPLLVLARGLTFVLLALTGLAALAFAACLPVALTVPQDVLSLLLRRDIYEVPPDAVASLAGTIALGALTLVGAAYFLKQLLDIIDSVAAGDPFVPANADRLTRMAWTVLGIQLLAVPLALVQYGLQRVLEPDESITTISFADNGLVLAVVLFILARVFRRGTAMRDDLEGTV